MRFTEPVVGALEVGPPVVLVSVEVHAVATAVLKVDREPVGRVPAEGERGAGPARAALVGRQHFDWLGDDSELGSVEQAHDVAHGPHPPSRR